MEKEEIIRKTIIIPKISLDDIPLTFDQDIRYKSITIYTDGACVPNPGVGSYAYVVIDDATMQPIFKFSRKETTETTNNRMELSAVISALTAVRNLKTDSIVLLSDSQYVVNMANKITKKTVVKKNVDLWNLFLTVKGENKIKPRISWIKGHAKSKYNIVADKLANEALKEK